MEPTRESETEKYRACYALPEYHLKGARYSRVFQDVESIALGASYLDVGCGRAESVKFGQARGLDARGLELVPELCDGRQVIQGVVTELPFANRSVDFVSCYDMLEHLPTDQVDRALDELFRVPRVTLFLTTNDRRSHHGHVELHLTRKPRSWWQDKINVRAGERKANVISSVFGRDEWHWQVDFPVP